MEPKKVLIIDDEPKMVEVIKTYIDSAGYKTYIAFNGKEGLAIYERIHPNLVILDLMLPDVSGEEICMAIRKKYRTPIIMLTAKTQERDIVAGLTIGADDYIIKPFKAKEVLARVEAVLRRSASDFLMNEPVSFGDGLLTMDFKNCSVKKQGVTVQLTPTEYKLLFTLAKTPEKTFTRDELILYALNDDFQGVDRSIDTYIKNIRQKIEPNPKEPYFLKTVHGLGYKFGGCI